MPLPVTHGLRIDRLHRLVRSGKAKGFTLVEVVLALGVFAVLIIGCIGLLSVSSNSLRSVVTRDEAVHLTGALKQHLNQLGFDQSYALIVNQTPLYICTYRAQSSGTNSDGTPTGYSGSSRNSGEDYLVVPTVRDALNVTQGNLLKNNDMPAREGRIFRVTLKTSLTNPLPNSLPPASTNYTEAVITVQAKFFPMNGDKVQNSNEQVPAQTCTIAVRR